jgi:hypothetical protein
VGKVFLSGMGCSALFKMIFFNNLRRSIDGTVIVDGSFQRSLSRETYVTGGVLANSFRIYNLVPHALLVSDGNWVVWPHKCCSEVGNNLKARRAMRDIQRVSIRAFFTACRSGSHRQPDQLV